MEPCYKHFSLVGKPSFWNQRFQLILMYFCCVTCQPHHLLFNIPFNNLIFATTHLLILLFLLAFYIVALLHISTLCFLVFILLVCQYVLSQWQLPLLDVPFDLLNHSKWFICPFEYRQKYWFIALYKSWYTGVHWWLKSWRWCRLCICHSSKEVHVFSARESQHILSWIICSLNGFKYNLRESCYIVVCSKQLVGFRPYLLEYFVGSTN